MSVVANIALNLDARGVPQKLREVQQGAQATEKAFNALNSAAAAFGAGFALTRVIADVRQLDTNLRRLGTVGGDVKALDKGLGALSERLGGISSKAELAAASYQALSAGFSDTAGNLKLVEAASKAAIGGMADTTQVVEVLTKTLNAYGMSGDQAIKVTDSISKAIEYGQVEWSDYTSQLGRVASIAAIAGVSLDEVNAFIAAATKNGATAEIAFTGLGAAINTLLQPTKESTEAAAALGIQWNIQGLQAKGFGGLLADLAKKQDTNKEAVARLLGSQEAMRGVFAANAKAGSDYTMILEGLGSAAGKTEADFKIMQGSLDNTLKALDTAFKNLSEALGKAFGPTVVIVVQDLTKAINGFASVMNAVPQPVMNTLGQIVKLIAQMLLLQKAVQVIIALRAGFVAAMLGMAGATTATGVAAKTSSSAFALYVNNTKTLEAASAAAASKAGGLLGVLRGLAAIGVITVGINLIVTGLQEAMAAAAETRRLRGERAAGGAAAIFGGSATKGQKGTAAKTLQQIRAEQNRYKQPGVIAAQTLLGPASQLFGIPTTAQAGARRTVLGERALRAQGVMALPTRIEAQQPTPTPVPSAPYQDTTGQGRDKKTDAERLAEQIASQKAAAAELLATEKGRLTVAQTAEPLQRLITEAIVQQNDIQRQYADKLKESKSAEETLNLQIAERNALQTNALELQRALGEETDRIIDPLKQLTDASAERLQFENKYQELLSQGINPELAKEFAQLELTAEKQTQILTLRLAELEGAKAKLQAESDVAKALQEQIDKIKEIMRLQGQAVAKSKQESEDEKKKREERERRDQDSKNQAERLKNLYSGVVNTIEDGIVNAISVGIEGLINGTKQLDQALKEIAAGVLQDIGKQLVRFGVNSLMRGVFPGAFANGGVFAANGIQPFAAGGIVNTPTLFPFAEGGAARTGLMGEAGPEAIMPLSRNSDGRLGVDASGLREAMGSASGSASAPVLNMSFQSTNIGGVEYVSRDQLEAAMAATRRQASRDGAKRGMSMTLDRLQQSPQTRNRIGIR